MCVELQEIRQYKDLKNQDDCYQKFYLYAHEGHGEGWSKLHF